jgi:xanthosine utilization system XapX-like protein
MLENVFYQNHFNAYLKKILIDNINGKGLITFFIVAAVISLAWIIYDFLELHSLYIPIFFLIISLFGVFYGYKTKKLSKINSMKVLCNNYEHKPELFEEKMPKKFINDLKYLKTIKNNKKEYKKYSHLTYKELKKYLKYEVYSNETLSKKQNERSKSNAITAHAALGVALSK